jgi:hypothetical protein
MTRSKIGELPRANEIAAQLQYSPFTLPPSTAMAAPVT